MEDYNKQFWDELKGKSFFTKVKWCIARLAVELILILVIIEWDNKHSRNHSMKMLKQTWWAKITGWAIALLFLYIAYKISKL